jgi:hypothetical protein
MEWLLPFAQKVLKDFAEAKSKTACRESIENHRKFDIFTN